MRLTVVVLHGGRARDDAQARFERHRENVFSETVGGARRAAPGPSSRSRRGHPAPRSTPGDASRGSIARHGVRHPRALLSFPARTDKSSLHDFTSLDVDRQPHDLSQHRGKVVVVTNVASY